MQAACLRFTTARMFYFVTLCASATALLGWLGVPVGCFVMLIWIQVLAGARREQTQAAEQQIQHIRDSKSVLRGNSGSTRTGVSKLELLVVLLIATLVVGLMIPAAPDFDLQQQAATSMCIVAKAVDAYEQHFGVPPPQVVWAEDGTPWHSWRALILPFMGEEKLAAAYRLDEPWNSPHNQRLAQYRPWHYRPFYPALENTARENTAREKNSPTTGDQELSRISSTLHLCSAAENGKMLVVEQEQVASSWLQPSQLEGWPAMIAEPDAQHGFWQHGFFTSAYRGRLAVDAHQAWRIHPHTPLPVVQAQLSTLGDRRASQAQREFYEVGEPLRQWHIANAMRLTIFLLVVLYPLRWLTPSAEPSLATTAVDARDA